METAVKSFSFLPLINIQKKCMEYDIGYFRKDAGWCDLYINGILSNRRQFPRHMRLDWPEGKLCLGKYMADSTYEEKKTGVFAVG